MSALDPLADDRRWVAWRNEERGPKGKLTKIPYGAAGKPAKADDPTTWIARQEATALAQRIVNGLGGGIGIELGDLGADLHLAGVDLDSCIDEAGCVALWAEKILVELPTYAEKSPSGTGAKALFYIPSDLVRDFLELIGITESDRWGCKRSVGQDGRDHRPAVEIYTNRRYFAVTESVFPGRPDYIAVLDWPQLERLARLIPAPRSNNPSSGSGADNSRSAIAFRKAAELRRAGKTYEEMVEALSRDPETAAWVREKGMAAGQRQLRRIWERTAPQGESEQPWPVPEPETLTLAYWLSRDLPEPDFMLGEVISTTTRVLIVAPTGLGKTHFGMAIGIAAADGANFLHWHGCGKPRRVLYIDGEMSRRLLKKRLADAARRLGTIPDAFSALSREDVPDMPPLNTEAGQKFINEVIERLGGVDLVIFDNIQSLLTGDDNFGAETWQQTLPWIRDLTRREISQIWIHHTGNDESHGWGTKTREWQLDTVLLLERVERPETDIAFRINFTKARERTPDNRTDFELAIITLADDQWTSERGGHAQTKKRTATDLALDVLKDEIARGNGSMPAPSDRIPPNTLCITAGAWRKAYELRSLAESKEAGERAFYRAARDLIEKRKLVAKHDLWVWPT